MSEVVQQLQGAFACLVKSTYYPNEVIGCKRGSPLIVGIVPGGSGAMTKQYPVTVCT